MVSKNSYRGTPRAAADPRSQTVHEAAKAGPWPTDDYDRYARLQRHSIAIQKELTRRRREAEEHQKIQDGWVQWGTEVQEDMAELEEDFIARERQLKKDYKAREKKSKEEIEYT